MSLLILASDPVLNKPLVGQTPSPYSGVHWPPHVTAADAVVSMYASSRPSSNHQVPDIVRFCNLFPQDLVALFAVLVFKVPFHPKVMLTRYVHFTDILTR